MPRPVFPAPGGRACDPPRLGIFTHTGLQKAILSGIPLGRLPVRDLANFSVISVRPSDQLGDALAVMIRARVHRVVVAELTSDGAQQEQLLTSMADIHEQLLGEPEQAIALHREILELDPTSKGALGALDRLLDK